MKDIYHAPQWQAFRRKVLAADGYRCTRCAQSVQSRTLQIHHKYYIKGRPPWSYPISACLVLCQPCHAQLHGKAQPMKGWQYMGYDLCRKGRVACENCGTSIKHCYFIAHPQWHTLQVGTVCCDQLTTTAYATNQRRKEEKRKKYLEAKKWKSTALEGLTRRYKGRHILVFEKQGQYALKIDQLFGRMKFPNWLTAQNHAFDIIHDGTLEQYEIRRQKN